MGTAHAQVMEGVSNQSIIQLQVKYGINLSVSLILRMLRIKVDRRCL
jgi:hypothetical protein